MGMMVIKLGEEEGDKEALERELPGLVHHPQHTPYMSPPPWRKVGILMKN